MLTIGFSTDITPYCFCHNSNINALTPAAIAITTNKHFKKQRNEKGKTVKRNVELVVHQHWVHS